MGRYLLSSAIRRIISTLSNFTNFTDFDLSHTHIWRRRRHLEVRQSDDDGIERKVTQSECRGWRPATDEERRALDLSEVPRISIVGANTAQLTEVVSSTPDEGRRLPFPVWEVLWDVSCRRSAVGYFILSTGNVSTTLISRKSSFLSS